MIITIDGPVASGKSTVARKLAQRLEMYYLGTGLMFRGLAYVLIEHASYDEYDLHNPKQHDLRRFLNSKIFFYDCDASCSGRILFDGQDVTSRLKNVHIDAAASILSTNKVVRQALLQVQRLCGQKCDLVAEGRDVGSVVFPNADAKFFLTASVLVRAQRWQADQKKKGNSVSLDEAINVISVRDERDSNREVAPLIKPHGAIVVDNSDCDIEKTLEIIEQNLQKK